jgi:hypothetical protein
LTSYAGHEKIEGFGKVRNGTAYATNRKEEPGFAARSRRGSNARARLREANLGPTGGLDRGQLHLRKQENAG